MIADFVDLIVLSHLRRSSLSSPSGGLSELDGPDPPLPVEMDDNNPQTVPIADQPVMPPAEMFAGMEGLVLPPVGGQQGWVPSAPPPVSSTSNTGPTPADGGQPPSVDYPNNGHDQGYQIPL